MTGNTPPNHTTEGNSSGGQSSEQEPWRYGIEHIGTSVVAVGIGMLALKGVEFALQPEPNDNIGFVFIGTTILSAPVAWVAINKLKAVISRRSPQD